MRIYIAVPTKFPQVLRTKTERMIKEERHDLETAQIIDESGNVVAEKELERIEVIIGYDGEICKHIHKLTKLKWIHLLSAGYDNLHKMWPDLKEEGVKRPDGQRVTITRTGGPFGYGGAMSEYVLFHVLLVEGNYRELWQRQLDREYDLLWQGNSANCRSFKDLTIGILGVGEIGSCIAEKCHAAGATVLGLVRTDSEGRTPTVRQYFTFDRINELLPLCDYIVSALPSTEKTRWLLDNSLLELCKEKQPVLINVGRGDLIKTDELIKALENGYLTKAVLDVMETEPLPVDSPLCRHPSVIWTPHISGRYQACNQVKCFLHNLARYEKNEKLHFIVCE